MKKNNNQVKDKSRAMSSFYTALWAVLIVFLLPMTKQPTLIDYVLKKGIFAILIFLAVLTVSYLSKPKSK